MYVYYINNIRKWKKKTYKLFMIFRISLFSAFEVDFCCEKKNTRTYAYILYMQANRANEDQTLAIELEISNLSTHCYVLM